MKSAVKTILTMLCLFPFISPASSEDIYAIYGGVGYLDKKTSPCLSELYDSGSKSYQTTRDSINKAVLKKLESTKFEAGNFNFILSSNHLNGALKKEGIEFKSRPSQSQIKEFLEDVNERLYTIAMIGSLEFHQQWKTQSSVPMYQDFITITVSSVIVQVGGDNPGSIALAGNGSVVGNIQDAGASFIGVIALVVLYLLFNKK